MENNLCVLFCGRKTKWIKNQMEKGVDKTDKAFDKGFFWIVLLSVCAAILLLPCLARNAARRKE